MRTCLLLLLAVVVAGLTSESTPVAAQAKKKKPKDQDSGPIDPFGRPKAFQEAKGPRFAVWFEDGRWQLRTTGKIGDKIKFTGGIEIKDGTVTTAVIQGLEKAKNPKDADWINFKQGRKGFTFTFVTGTKVDGFYFQLSNDATEMTLHLLADGDDDPKHVLIGAAGRHPDKAIFTLPAAPKKE